MTREEAIYVLNELLEKVKVSPNKTNILAKEKQALEMAIEALKREMRALQLRSIVRNIDGWQNIVNEVARLEAEEKGEKE